VEQFFSDLVERGKGVGSCIVDQDIELTKCFLALGEETRDVELLGHIPCIAIALPPAGYDCGNDFPRVFLAG